MELWPIGDALYVEMLDMLDSANDSPLNAATVTYIGYTVTKVAGAEVLTAISGCTGTCSYVAASSGDYRGTITAAITAMASKGDQIRVVISFAQSAYITTRTLNYRAGPRGRD